MNKVLKLFHIIMASPAFCKPFSGCPVGVLFLPVFFHKRNPRDTGPFVPFPHPLFACSGTSPLIFYENPPIPCRKTGEKASGFHKNRAKLCFPSKTGRQTEKNAKNPRTFVPGLSAYDFERSSCMKRKQLAVFNRFSLL